MNLMDSVVQHMAKVRNMARTLNDVGEQISEIAIMAKILVSLPTKFNALKTAWDRISAASQIIVFDRESN